MSEIRVSIVVQDGDEVLECTHCDTGEPVELSASMSKEAILKEGLSFEKAVMVLIYQLLNKMQTGE